MHFGGFVSAVVFLGARLACLICPAQSSGVVGTQTPGEGRSPSLSLYQVQYRISTKMPAVSEIVSSVSEPFDGSAEAAVCLIAGEQPEQIFEFEFEWVSVGATGPPQQSSYVGDISGHRFVATRL